MKNFVSRGNTLNYTAGASETVSSGDLLVIGDMVGVALGDAGNNETVPVQVSGIVRLTKATAAGAINQGDAVFATSGGEITDSDDGTTPAGFAAAAAAADATEITVLLNGNSAA